MNLEYITKIQKLPGCPCLRLSARYGVRVRQRVQNPPDDWRSIRSQVRVCGGECPFHRLGPKPVTAKWPSLRPGLPAPHDRLAHWSARRVRYGRADWKR
jgi:hypothetical protein